MPPGGELVLPPNGHQQRFSPCNPDHDEDEKLDRLDCASVQSEPVRPPPVELPKRDSFSDSGAEGSGHNTPTRGRTFTEGLLRFVQDSSLQKPVPERRVSAVDAPGQSMEPGMTSNASVPLAAHVPVIQANHSQQFSTINQGQFSGVIQQTHIPEASYHRDLAHDLRAGSMSSQGYQPVMGSQPSAAYPSSMMDQRYSYIPSVSSQPHGLQVLGNQVRPTKSASPPVRQEARPPANLQSQMLGGETHSLRQPIMSSIAQPSMTYSNVTGLVPMMMMPSASQGVYLAPRYQAPLGTMPGTPASPPGIEHRVGNGGLLNGGAGLQHPGLMNLSGVTNLHGAYRPLPGYSNLPINLAHQVIPEPSQSLMHDPGSLVTPMPGVLNPGSAAINHNASLLGSSAMHGAPYHNQGVLSPASLAGLSINHGAIPAGASYPGLPGVMNQQVPHPHPGSLNPTPVPSLAGSMAGSYHESVHLEESLKGSAMDLDASKQS